MLFELVKDNDKITISTKYKTSKEYMEVKLNIGVQVRCFKKKLILIENKSEKNIGKTNIEVCKLSRNDWAQL